MGPLTVTEKPTTLRLLLVEDDTVSRMFISQALASLPAQVDTAGSIAEACQQAQQQRHVLWLIDVHLPDGDGTDCLAALSALQSPCPALAITAEAHRDDFARLQAAGFLHVLQKPISIAALQKAVRSALGQSTPNQPVAELDSQIPVWDEAQALAAVGSQSTLTALKRMFLDELREQHQQVVQACRQGDGERAQALLHRLKASCGFVGAAQLLAAVQLLSAAPFDSSRLQHFEQSAQTVLASHAPHG